MQSCVSPVVSSKVRFGITTIHGVYLIKVSTLSEVVNKRKGRGSLGERVIHNQIGVKDCKCFIPYTVKVVLN